MLGVLESGGGRLLGVILEVVGVRTGGVDVKDETRLVHFSLVSRSIFDPSTF